MTKECSYAAATTAVPGDQKCGKSEASVPKNERQTSSSSLRAKSVGLIAVIFYAVVTAAVSFYLYFIVSESEENGLQVQFDADASIVLDSIEDITITKLEALSSLAVAFTSQAIANNNTWPFVTLNSFHERAASVRSISGALFLEILPVVSDEDRAEWEAYSVQRLGWVGGGRAYEAQQAKDDAGRSRERVLNGGDTQLQQGSDDIFPRPPSPTIPVEGPPLEFAAGSSNRIYAIDKNLAPYVDPGPGYYGTLAYGRQDFAFSANVHVF